MDLGQLEIFCAVAEEGSITAAAAKLHRVPSNLTTRVKQLEADLGVDLFIREKLRLRLSPTGKTFLEYSRKILNLVAEARHAVEGKGPSGVFPLGSLESTAAVRIPSLLASFHHAYPEVQLDLSTGPSGEMIEGVLSGRLAAAFVDGPLRHPSLRGMSVFDEEMVVVAPKGHHPINEATDVTGGTIYAFRANCSYRRHFENWFADVGALPGRIVEMESYHGMLACIAAGGGIAMMPRSMLDALPKSVDVQVFNVDTRFSELKTWLIWREGMVHSNVRALIRLLEPAHDLLARAGLSRSRFLRQS